MNFKLSIILTLILAQFLILSAQTSLKQKLILISEKKIEISELEKKIEKTQALYSKIIGEAKPKEDPQKVKLEISRLKSKHKNVETEILRIEADIYEEEKSQPVWGEGYGEVELTNKVSYEKAKRLALMYARRDAMESGGKMVVESLTKLKKVEIITKSGPKTESDYFETYLNIIQSKAMVEVIEQDMSGDYGKIKKEKRGKQTFLTVKVRFKMRSIEGQNPFREKLKKLEI